MTPKPPRPARTRSRRKLHVQYRPELFDELAAHRRDHAAGPEVAQRLPYHQCAKCCLYVAMEAGRSFTALLHQATALGAKPHEVWQLASSLMWEA